jgi:two-component system, NarL family, sensor histidine kinase NreB
MPNLKKKSKTSKGTNTHLRQSLKQLEDIKFALDTSTIVAITDIKGRITYANDKFCEISQLSRGELLGRDHRIVNSDYHSKEFMRGLWQTISSGRVWKGEIRNKAKDGTIYWVDTTIVPFFDDQGKPYQYIAIHYDVTKRKEMEEAIKSLPQRIIQAQEKEHERISREIHDDLGQSLATFKMIIQASHQELIQNKTDYQTSFKKIIQHLNTIIDKTRKLASGLRPSSLEVLGLSTALKTMINDFRYKKDLQIEFSCGKLDNLIFEGEVMIFPRKSGHFEELVVG